MVRALPETPVCSKIFNKSIVFDGVSSNLILQVIVLFGKLRFKVLRILIKLVNWHQKIYPTSVTNSGFCKRAAPIPPDTEKCFGHPLDMLFSFKIFEILPYSSQFLWHLLIQFLQHVKHLRFRLPLVEQHSYDLPLNYVRIVSEWDLTWFVL